MLGPNALTQELLQSYLRYLFSAHPIGVHNPDLEASLRTRLRDERPLVKGPILELDPASKPDATVAALIRENVLCGDMGYLKAGQNDLSSRTLYTHQVAAIRASVAGNSVVVASGTGSGKTEAWLYPVVNEMLASPGSGLRAIVLYPMNALADDQRRIRMRGLLGDTKVTYGEYTGNTPRDESDRNARIDPAAPSNELQTRRRLRETPPNILITNPSMLEYLLLRPEDNALFRGANLQFLVLDEAHTYRGAYGIELGHLIRRLKARLGVPSVRSFVLSATLDPDLASIARFAGDLTGETFDESCIFFGDHEQASPVQDVVHRPLEAYIGFTADAIANILKDPATITDVPGSDLLGEDRVLKAAEAASGPRALWDLLHPDGNVIALRELLQDGPRPIADLARIIFGPHAADIDHGIARLIDAAASARETDETASLLPARYHVFLRGLDGLRICFNPEHGCTGAGAHMIGRYYLDSRDTCDCSYPLWELLVCGDCAAWYVRDHGDGAAKLDAELSGAERTLHIVDLDDEEEPAETPLKRCLLCRAVSGCDCPEEARRVVVATKHRKTCLNCGSDNVMGVMTGTMAPTQVLAEVLTGAQDSDPKYKGRGSGKKLLTFSDSRRGAAQFAAQLDRAHKQHVQRAAIYQALRSAPGVVGLDELAARVAKVLEKYAFYDVSANNVFNAKALVFEEFTASYASRRRLEALGVGASHLLFSDDPPQGLIDLVGSESDAKALMQALLEIMQYDSAVAKPEFMGPLRGYAGARPDVFYALSVGPKRWIAPEAPIHQRQRSRQFNLAARLVGLERTDLLLKAVWDHAVSDGVLVGEDGRRQLSSDRLAFSVPAQWYRCSSCRRVTPYALSDGRGCATRNCEGILNATSEAVRADDHFTQNVIGPIEYFQIKEHTAQLNVHEARHIGNEFRDGKVNILSCSTTFELGVDIGTLQSVFMRNVPPSVANYRQRAGRAGRSRQGAAYLLTYCGPTPHDRVFFENPGDIITGELAVPAFNLSNQQLVARHINSLLLSSLWRFIGSRLGARNTVEDFLLAEDAWDIVAEWRDKEDPTLAGELRHYAQAMNRDVGELKSAFCGKLAEERSLVQDRLDLLITMIPSLSGAALRNVTNEIQRLRERRLIEHFSARALLPSYAFPIYVVELQTPDNKVSLQRDLRIAISEYAPGSQVVANKHIFESVAVILKGPTAGAKTPYLDVWYCDSCQAAYSVDQETCTCGSAVTLKHAHFMIPDGFMTDMTKGAAETISRAHSKAAKSSQHVLASGNATESVTIGPVRATKYENARFLFLNHGSRGEQFRICLSCGSQVTGKSQGSHKTPYGRKCSGQILWCMLGHVLIGEALALQIDDADGLEIPNDQVFHQTLSYALAEGVSKALSIERRDLGVSVRHVNRGDRMRWEIMILDNVPGGAGYVAQIMRPGGLEKSLGEALKIASCGNCPEESTCYACLRSMGNQALHDRMRRGPAMRFIRAVCDRISGASGVFGVDVDRWFRGPDVQEALIVVPTMTDVIAHRILELGTRCDVTVVLDKAFNPRRAAWIDAWRTLWSSRVRLLMGVAEKASLAVKRADDWQIIFNVAPSDVAYGTIHEGRLVGGGEAAALRSELLKDSSPLREGAALPAHMIPLAAGRKTSEKELFGHLFDGVVDKIEIEDPYLFEDRHERRLAAWLDLPKTQARFLIATTQPEELERKRQQQAMFARIKARYGQKHSIHVAYRNKRDMHDRNVIVKGEQSVRISLPKGLDFIDKDGVVDKDTSVTIVSVQ